jgi:hypothetical protein
MRARHRTRGTISRFLFSVRRAHASRPKPILCCNVMALSSFVSAHPNSFVSRRSTTIHSTNRHRAIVFR